MSDSRPQTRRGEGSNDDDHQRFRHRCGTMDEHRRLLRLDPEYRWRRRQIERDVQEWIGLFGEEGARSGLIRIPVVVHVIWHTDAENVSDAQIDSQLAVLNADFRRLNADAGSTPSAFAGVAADARLEFALAVRGPNCQPTTGITRTKTSTTGWTRSQTGMLSAAGGGHDPWDQTKYLNIWVCNYTDGLLGKGSFPGMPNQGVRCHYRAFGTIGSLIPEYNRGRTLTHEIGHYLNLNHIWGDDQTSADICSGSDNVSDTPNQGVMHFGTPSFPQISCGNGPDGDMFMNYMDYTDDVAMNLFTVQQSVRMDATLHTVRASLLASDGLVPPSGVAGPDLWSKDVSDDFGAEPDTSTQPMYISDDIWVRNDNNGLVNHDHQNPEYGSTVSVYVRVRNRACSGTGAGTVKLYWAKASTGLAWPAPWDGTVASPALMGAQIGSQPVSVAGGDDEILVFSWTPPNPDDYASFGADSGHFCLLSRIETGPAPDFGMTTPETGNLYANVRNNNNIVWKNITVVADSGGRSDAAIVTNYGDEPQRATLVFSVPRRDPVSIFDWGQVWFDMTPEMTELWKRSGAGLFEIDQIGETTFRVLGPGASLGPLELRPAEIGVLQLRFVRTAKKSLGVRILTLDLEQVTDNGVVGGQRFMIKTAPDRGGVKPDKPVKTFDGVTWVDHVGGGGCNC
jgi:hypothetical protein